LRHSQGVKDMINVRLAPSEHFTAKGFNIGDNYNKLPEKGLVKEKEIVSGEIEFFLISFSY